MSVVSVTHKWSELCGQPWQQSQAELSQRRSPQCWQPRTHQRAGFPFSSEQPGRVKAGRAGPDI